MMDTDEGEIEVRVKFSSREKCHGEIKFRAGKRVKSHRYLVVLTMKKKMEGEINFIMSHRLEESIIRMIRFQMENKSMQCVFNKCPPKSSKNKKFNFFG